MGNCDAAESKPKEIIFSKSNPQRFSHNENNLKMNTQATLNNSKTEIPLQYGNPLQQSTERISRKTRNLSRENGLIKETSRGRIKNNIYQEKVMTNTKKGISKPK